MSFLCDPFWISAYFQVPLLLVSGRRWCQKCVPASGAEEHNAAVSDGTVADSPCHGPDTDLGKRSHWQLSENSVSLVLLSIFNQPPVCLNQPPACLNSTTCMPQSTTCMPPNAGFIWQHDWMSSHPEVAGVRLRGEWCHFVGQLTQLTFIHPILAVDLPFCGWMLLVFVHPGSSYWDFWSGTGATEGGRDRIPWFAACILHRVVSYIDPNKNWGNTIEADLTTNLGKVVHKLNYKAERRTGIETPFVQRALLKGCLKVVGWLV